MELQLQDKVVVVTGAGKGIGRSIADRALDEGAFVVAGSRTGPAQPTASGERLTTMAVDLATPGGPVELIAAAYRVRGRIDVLVNNVGASEPGPTFADIDDQAWQRIFEVNFFSAVRAVRAALPALRETCGAVVNIGSLNAKLPDPAIAHYSAAKAALANLGQSLAIELADAGVRVNTISPGPVRTPMWTGPDGFARHLAAAADVTPERLVDEVMPDRFGVLTGRFSTAEEVADLALFLASARAANITGADYVLDGGMHRAV